MDDESRMMKFAECSMEYFVYWIKKANSIQYVKLMSRLFDLNNCFSENLGKLV